MSKPMQKRIGIADGFSRGFDILRLGVEIHARAVTGLLRMCLVISAAGTVLWCLYDIPLTVIFGAFRWSMAWVVVDLLRMDVDGVPLVTTDGLQHWTAARVRADAWHMASARQTLGTFLQAGMVALGLSVPLALVIFGAAIWRGREATANLLARGQRLIDERRMAQLVRRRGDRSGLAIGTVGVPEEALNRSVLFLGAPQTGKSVSIKRWMRAIRRRGDLVIVFDKVGDATEEFFDQSRGDVLLNPLDSRSPPWSPWAEMREIADASRIAKSLIPTIDGNNNFFHEGAQQLFAALLTRIWRLPDRSLQALLEAALLWDKEKKAALLAGTDAAKHYQGDHRSGHDVDATAAVYTQALRFLPATAGTGSDFSIRDFITDTVARLEARPAAAKDRILTRFDADIAQLLEARHHVRHGDMRRALRTLNRFTPRFPLLPDGLVPPRVPSEYDGWWAAHRDPVEAHWNAQDAAIPQARRALGEAHDAAAATLKRKGAPWLFIGSNQRQLQAIRPVLSLWLDAVADTIMSLPANRSRRIWVFLDELQALQELPSLQPLLTEGAKYGACVVAGVQNMGQLRATYGRDRAEVLLSLFQTMVMFRLPEPDTADWCQRRAGDAIVEHVHESIRYGTSETMDGAQLQIQRVTEPILMAGDVMRQKNLHCYVMFPGDWPIASVQLRFNARTDAGAKIAPALVRRPTEDTIFYALDQQGWTPLPEGPEGGDAGEAARIAARFDRDDDDPITPSAPPRESDERPAPASDAAATAPRSRGASAASKAGTASPGAATSVAGAAPIMSEATAATPAPTAPSAAGAPPAAAHATSPTAAPTAPADPALARPPLSDLARSAIPAAPRTATDVARKPARPRRRAVVDGGHPAPGERQARLPFGDDGAAAETPTDAPGSRDDTPAAAPLRARPVEAPRVQSSSQGAV
jgi:type IV secretory pathway TraG/TraD family ATPase VirD4